MKWNLLSDAQPQSTLPTVLAMPSILNSKAASCLERPASLAQLGKYTKGIMNPENIHKLFFNTNPVADPAAGWSGARNMKSMRPSSAAIFFMPYFYRAGGPSPPPPPQDPQRKPC